MLELKVNQVMSLGDGVVRLLLVRRGITLSVLRSQMFRDGSVSSEIELHGIASKNSTVPLRFSS